ncbi:MAG TPA: hypothetical protein VLY04_18830 [Bryobacteraceae bacterium]|nr:hypothetical protein [Bryobacteraceae bacterium]
MLLLQLALVLALLAVCGFAPGFFFVRRLRWNPLEKLCGSIGLSLVLVYLASWTIYCFSPRGDGMPIHVLPFALVSAASAAMGIAAWKDIRVLVRSTAVRRALEGYGFLLVWTLALMAMIRNYSGALWFGDWLEHFQRSLFFLRGFPADTIIFPGYALPARPPMMNVLTAFFLAQTQDRFELFQVVFVFLNLLLFLPCCLVMPALGRRARRRTWLLVALFAVNPVVMQNATYTWTKVLAAFYVVLALWLYLAGWRKNDRLRTTAAFVALAAGILVHYSAGPYVAFLALHYLLRVFPKRQWKWRELAGITAASGLLLGTWLVWSLAVYGAKVTFASNSSVTASQKYTGSTAGKIALNLWDSIVPVLARDPALLRNFDQPSSTGSLRDKAFVFYQLNLVFGMGLVGGPLALWLLYREWRRKPPVAPPAPQRSKRRQRAPASRKAPAAEAPERWFWRFMIACCVVVGIAVVGERDPLGVPHLTMLPLEALGVSLVAALVPWRNRAVASLLLAGCAVDFSLGVFLHARVESEENTTQHRVFAEITFSGGDLQTAPPPDSLSPSAWRNWYWKHLELLNSRWLEQLPRQDENPASQQGWQRVRSNIERLQQQLNQDWQGWYGRHGGQVTFLGDHLAGVGTNIAAGTVLMLFVGLMAGVAVRCFRAA